MGRIQCAGYGRWFHRDPKVPYQRYCSRASCQRARSRLWQKEKLATDEDYRGNQADAQRRWRESQRDYWRKYRESHPDYGARNRRLRRERNHSRRRHPIAKMDALIVKIDLVSAA